MQTVTLRTLVREPGKVKKLTSAGLSVQVTDNGAPLWIIRGMENPTAEAERLRITDDALDEVLNGRVSKISLAKIIEDSRR